MANKAELLSLFTDHRNVLFCEGSSHFFFFLADIFIRVAYHFKFISRVFFGFVFLVCESQIKILCQIYVMVPLIQVFIGCSYYVTVPDSQYCV